MANRRVLLILAAGAALAGSLAALGFYNYYVFFVNETSHTGMPVGQVQAAFAIEAVVSTASLRVVRHRMLLLCLAVGLLGAAETFLLDQLGVMSFYEDWAARGLETRTFGCWFLNCR